MKEKWKKFKEDTTDRYDAEFDYMADYPVMWFAWAWKWISIVATTTLVIAGFFYKDDEVTI